MKKKIKLNFLDFWPNFIKTDNYFYNLLSLKYDVLIDEIDPDYILYSVYGDKNKEISKNDKVKILYLAENQRPNFDECNYSLSFDYMDDNRNYRLPLWALILDWFDTPYRADRDHAYHHNIDNFLKKRIGYPVQKNKFCSFIVSNPNCDKRNFFGYLLNQYKKLDCPSRVLNNMRPIGGRGDQIEKIKFLEPYKFNLCFENSSHYGYCTEKIIHSMFMNCIPIYWGDPLVHQDFNRHSFLNWHDYNDDEKLLHRIIEIDNNPKLYNDIINQPWFNDNQIPDFVKPESVLNFFEKIIECR